MHLPPLRLRRSLFVLVLLSAALPACATHRVPQRPAIDAPLPLVVGVCPGPFADYGGEGRDLLGAIRERRLFREVVALPERGSGPHVDLLLTPHIEAREARTSGLGVATLVPWVATATVFPWLVDVNDAVQVRVQPSAPGPSSCASAAATPLVVRDGPRRRVRSMLGWTSLLMPVLPRWDRGDVHEFRPAVDSLVARRAELLSLASTGESK